MLSALGTWYPGVFGYENLREETVDQPAGVLVVTDADVNFLAWSGDKYVPTKTISRADLKVVAAEGLGKSRRLVLVTEDELNTFELVREDRRYVDTAGTEAIAALLGAEPGGE